MYAIKNENLVAKYIALTVNEPTIGLCQIQQHVKQKLPGDVALAGRLRKSYEVLVAAIPDVEATILQAKQVKTLEKDFLARMKTHLDSANSSLEKVKK